MNDAMVLMVLNRKCGLIWLWSILSSILVARAVCSSSADAAICVDSSWPKPVAMDFWVSLMWLARR